MEKGKISHNARDSVVLNEGEEADDTHPKTNGFISGEELPPFLV